MIEPSTCRYRACRQVVWGNLIGACLLLFGSQASAVDASAQQEARNKTAALLERAQDEAGRRPTYLPEALARIRLGLKQSAGDPLQYGQWLETLWHYHLLNDDHAQAKQALEESLQHLTVARADPVRIASVTADLSYSLILLGEVAKAKECLRRAIVIANQQDDRGLLADLYYTLGDAYRKTGERLVARRYFEAAYEIDKTSGNAFKISISDLKLGSLARDSGNYEEAIRRHEHALEVFTRERNYRELVTHIELARDYAAQGKLALAERYTQRALDDGRALPEQRIDASVLLLRLINDYRTRVADAPNQAARAAALVRDIETLIHGSSTRQKSELARPTHQLQFAEQAIRHYALSRDVAKVKAHGQAAIGLARRVAGDLRAINDDSLAWLTAAQPVLNEYVKALYELDRSQVLPLLETYYTQQAEPAALRHSGVVGRAYEAKTVELFERYRTAQRLLIDATADFDRLHPTATDTAHLQSAQSRLDQLLREWDRARDAYLAMYQAQPIAPPPKQPQATAPLRPPAVPATDILIRYFIQENVSFGVALAGNDIRYFKLPPRSEVLMLVQHALDALKQPGGGERTQATLSSLSRLLPRDFIGRYSDATRLIIVPDDAVQPLPFAAIDMDERPDEYAPLVERFEIVRAKSASSYYARQPAIFGTGARAPLTTDIIVFANPVLGTRLPELPSSRAEAASIVKIFASRVTTYLGEAATNEVLLSPNVRAAKVLHIATHAYFSKTTPDIVGLVTSGQRSVGLDDGFLGLTELFTKPFSSRLVVVSGCETMRGKDYTGWGVRSLADGFLSQGAGSVVGTLWSVSDAATAALMDGFYRTLHRSGSSSTALRAAQRELIASRRFADPYYWSGVALESSNRSFDQHAL